MPRSHVVVELTMTDVKSVTTDDNAGEEVAVINGATFNLTIPRQVIEDLARRFQENDRLRRRS